MNKTNESVQPILVYPQYPNQEDDEINLFEIWRLLVVRKKLIFSITLFFALASVVSVFLLPKTWQTSVDFIALSLESVEIFTMEEQNNTLTIKNNILNIKNINNITSDTIFKKYSYRLQSLALKRSFFEQNNLASYYIKNPYKTKAKLLVQIEDAFQVFNTSLTIKSTASAASIFFNFLTQEHSNEILNQYTNYVETRVLDDLLMSIQNKTEKK